MGLFDGLFPMHRNSISCNDSARKTSFLVKGIQCRCFTFNTDHTRHMEYQKYSIAMVKPGCSFPPKAISQVFNNPDGHHNRYLDLNGFIGMPSVIQSSMVKMQLYDPEFTGSITLVVNQMMDAVCSAPLLCFFDMRRTIAAFRLPRLSTSLPAVPATRFRRVTMTEYK